MRIALTGASGFLGGALAAAIEARGDDLVRLGRRETATERDFEVALAGADALIHCAGRYEIGVSGERRAVLEEANVALAARAFRAARKSGTRRVVHISTIAIFGDTGGIVADEAFTRTSGPTSFYDETKSRAHALALAAIRDGLPAVIAQPGQLVGPGDHSGVGAILTRVAHGRLPLIAFDDVGLSVVHVDDCAAGVLQALDRGRVGEAYLLGGENVTFGAAARAVARLAGKRPPLHVPAWPLRPLLLLTPALREMKRATDGVTYWGSSEKGRFELGYAPRDLEHTLRDAFVPT